jgi:hypothetical protein
MPDTPPPPPPEPKICTCSWKTEPGKPAKRIPDPNCPIH